MLKKILNCTGTVGMIISLVLSGSAHADEAIHLAPIARTDAGEIAYMNQYAAEKYCQKHGMSLPTAYELAQALNPKGVRKTEDIGFVPIFNGIRSVGFYYNTSTYPRPPSKVEDEIGSLWFWSSSILPSYMPNAAYAFNYLDGEIDEGYRDGDFHNTVRCVVRRR
jgi:hypothetical protein